MKLAVATCIMALHACDAPDQGSDATAVARFGILFGGQVQQRDELPFELDPAKQQQGFRVTLPTAPSHPREIIWEVSRPSGSRRGPARVTELGRGEISAGQTVFEQAILFEPGDPLGLWNIRVVLEDHVLIDRPFVVYDKRRRARTHPDAGPTIP